MLNIELIRAARERIQPFIHRTPVATCSAFNEVAGCEVYFKCENLQRAGAFKIRGATNKIRSLTDDERRRGVVAFSSGNHAQAVGLASREAGVRAVIAMPTDAPRAKLEATRAYGAEVRFYDRQKDDREAFTREIGEREGLTLVPPYDDFLVMAGAGTCAVELLEDVPELDCIVTPTGGGGLFSGVSTAAKGINPGIRCFPVEADTANDTWLSFHKGERVKINPPPTIADGLRNQSPGELTFPIIQRNAEDILLVTDEEITTTLRFILFRMKLLVETTGAVASAAVLHHRLPRDVRRVGVILSGGNIDMELLARILGEEEKTR